MRHFAVPLLVCLAAACASTRPPSPPPTQPSQPTPAQPQQLQPPRSANGLGRVTQARPIREPRIRVGMLSDQSGVSFPRVDGGYFVSTDAESYATRRGLTIAAPVTNALVRYAVQVSSISDINSVQALAEKLRNEMKVRGEFVFDPASGLYRVLAGDFPDAGSANPLRDQLQSRGYGKDMLVVKRPNDQPFDKKLTITDDEGETTTLAVDSLLLLPQTGETIHIGEKPYRGAARLWINSRGLLNVINELNLEDYLKGVVPAEMGPKVYDELEALKAQAIAARTYAVRNFGQYRREGYDICPGPACQAYNGFSGEDPLSNKAVEQSAGLVITYNGQPIDALYTATCGGETSDVGVMFPGRSEPYLVRARCVELEMTSIAGRGDSGLLNEQQMNGRMFAAIASLPEGAWSARDIEAAVAAALRLAGGQMPPSVPHAASSRRGDVLTYLAGVFAFDANGRTLTLPEDRKYFFPQSGSETTPYQAAAFLIKWGFVPTQQIDHIDLNTAMPREELYGILGTWLRKHQALLEVTGKIVSVNGRSLVIKTEGRTSTHTLPAGIPIFRRLGDRWQEYASVPVLPGDRAFVQQNGRKTPVALIVQGSADGAAFDRTSSLADWTRSYRADDLVTSINKRNPIQQLLGLRPLTVDPSNRIAELEVTAEGGRTFTLRGLPIRWSLNVPDNLFVFEKTSDPDGVDRYTFYGKGWGHGVGFCQVGAYGMAFRGRTAEEILTHYYTGVQIMGMAEAKTPPPAQ
jgi:stage II sporulation protein D